MRITHDQLQQIPVKRKLISQGDLGIDETVEQMKQVILASLGDQTVRVTAEQLIGGVGANNRRDEATAIYLYVRDKVRYTKDPKDLEYIQTPHHLITRIQQQGQAFGDCDDKTVLGLALLKNIGFDVAIRVASYSPVKTFTHVYGLVKIDQTWVPFDATPQWRQLGWEHPGVTRLKDYYVSAYGYDMDEVMGLTDEFSMGSVLNVAMGITLGGLLTAWLARRR